MERDGVCVCVTSRGESLTATRLSNVRLMSQKGRPLISLDWHVIGGGEGAAPVTASAIIIRVSIVPKSLER